MIERQLAALFPAFPPPSLVEQIMQYHKSHSNSLRLAHITTPNYKESVLSGHVLDHQREATPIAKLAVALAPFFNHIHITHASSRVLTYARDGLSNYHAQHWHQARFTFAHKQLPNDASSISQGSVDLHVVLCAGDDDGEFDRVAAAGHWMDVALRMLTPNGVLAAVKMSELWSLANDNQLGHGHHALRGAVDELRGALSRGPNGAISEHGLDWLDYETKFFYENVTKRISINLLAVGSDGLLRAEQRRIKAQDRLFAYYSSRGDSEADGWHVEVDSAWFREYAGVALLGNPYLSWEDAMFIEQALQRIEGIYRMAGAGNGNGVRIELGCSLVLLTRNAEAL